MKEYSKTPNEKSVLPLKRQVLEIGIIMFSKKGYYHTTFEEISKITDIEVEKIYSAFGDKKALFIECFEFYIKRLKKELNMNALFEIKDKKELIRAFVNNYYKAYKVLPEFQKQIMAFSMIDNEFKKLVNIFEFEIQEHISRILKVWMKDLRTDDIYVSSFFVHSILESTITKAIFSDMKVLERNMRKELHNLLFNYLFSSSENMEVSK